MQVYDMAPILPTTRHLLLTLLLHTFPSTPLSPQVGLESGVTVDGFRGTYADSTALTGNLAVNSPNILLTTGLGTETVGNEVLEATQVRAASLQPSVSTTIGATNIEGLYNLQEFVNRLTYIVGANLGLPFGLPTTAGRRRMSRKLLLL
jgi:hypothetical protein